MENMVAEYPSSEDYHLISWFHLAQFRPITVSLSSTANLGAVICCSSSSLLEKSVEIASLANVEVARERSYTGEAEGEAMDDGWTRYFTSIS
jgi:hypothetical protein